MNIIKNLSSYKDNFVTVHQGSEQPEISVVMPVYNCEEFVAEAITSVLKQEGVAVEILISDDASTDNTFAVAYQTVVDYISKSELKHTILMRVGTSRLVRDHLHLMAEKTSCDLVCQSHGDDISHRLRCAVLVKAFNEQAKNASMILVNASLIDHQGKILLEPKNSSLVNITIKPMEYEKILKAQDDILIGSNMAWRKSSLKHFPELTTSYCAYGHDRVMTFRSFLSGGCYFVDVPLVKRRHHKNQLHRELLSFDHKSVNSFNAQIIRITLFTTMINDLISLKEKNLIEEDKYNLHSKNINYLIIQAARFLSIATCNLVSDKYVNKWIKSS
jgi:glycosyltransferase involved in cell wall biosynthesis